MKKKERGFSLMEILVVMGLMAILATVAMRSLSGFRNEDSLVSASDIVRQTVEEARSLTLSSKNDQQHGVHFESTQVVLFEGTTYSSSDPDNVVRPLPSSVTITDIDLSGGGDDVVFKKLSGETDEPGTIEVTVTSISSAQATTTIYKTGVTETVSN